VSTITADTRVQPDMDRARNGFPQVLRSEWTKLWSVRSTVWTLLIAVVVTLGISTLVAWGTSTHLAQMPAKQRALLDVTSNSLSGLGLGQLAIAVLGVLIITGEYSTGGIKTTLTAVPNRMRVLGAKALVFAVIAWVTGTIVSFGSFFVAMPFWAKQNMATHLGDPGVLRAVLGGGLLVLASGMFGLAIGTLMRHTAGAITVTVALLFLLPSLIQLLPGDWGAAIAKRFTINSGAPMLRVLPDPSQLTPWVGYAWLTAEWLLLLLIGAWLMRRRDA
jgi:ABC-2 type transport system permease protein